MARNISLILWSLFWAAFAIVVLIIPNDFQLGYSVSLGYLKSLFSWSATWILPVAMLLNYILLNYLLRRSWRPKLARWMGPISVLTVLTIFIGGHVVHMLEYDDAASLFEYLMWIASYKEFYISLGISCVGFFPALLMIKQFSKYRQSPVITQAEARNVDEL